MIFQALWIALAGALGALARWAISTIGSSLTSGEFPLGTLLVNALGCFAFGWFVAWSQSREWSDSFRLATTVGFLGAFTTFSTFGFETLELWKEGKEGWAVLNAVLQNGLGLAAVAAGWVLAKSVRTN
ncbi:MAG: fluoride efflux transporter CrcB [Planctomycetes bacterium]|nr:fluoride efflux transporter CrcB [Planctomycetota bacterium]